MKNIEIPVTHIPNLDKFIKQYINNHIRFHTIQLFKRSGHIEYVPEGTGILVDFYGISCLFTSSHIVKTSFGNNQLYLKLGPEEYILCTGSSEESEPKRKSLDLAYIVLDLPIAESLIEIGYKFLTTDKLLPNHDTIETQQYAVIGFPKDTHTNGSYIIGPMAPDNYYDNQIYTKEDNFIMSYKQPQEIMTGIQDKSKELYDMSGCGLWFISTTENHEIIEYDYHLTGIMIELYIHKRHQFLIATKINLLTDQLKTAIS